MRRHLIQITLERHIPVLKWTAVLLFGGLCLAMPLMAQDALFTQQALNPLTINPAFAGQNDAMRASVHHRSQWRSVAVPFTTSAAAFDMAMGDDINKKTGRFGIGLLLSRDIAGEPRFESSAALLNLAYHINLSAASKLSAGMNAGYDQHVSATPVGEWGSQYNGYQYDPSIASGENFGADQQSHIDLGGGVVFSSGSNSAGRKISKTWELNIGVAAYHMGRVALARADWMTYETAPRYTGFINGRIALGVGPMALMPAVYYHHQGQFQQTLLGSFLQFNLNDAGSFSSSEKPMTVAAGVFCRTGDAIIAKALFEFSDFAIGMSYDFNYSGLSAISNGRGGMELALVWRK